MTTHHSSSIKSMGVFMLCSGENSRHLTCKTIARKSRRRITLLCAAIAAVILWTIFPGRLAWAQDQPIIFSVMGDQPYGLSEVPIVQQFMADHNRYSPSEFLVHLGDIKGQGEPCTSERFAITADLLKQLAVPVFVLPGDNEWTDCENPDAAWGIWSALFFDFEKNFCGPPAVERQSGRPENFAFVSKGVLFIGINLVGGPGHPDENVQDQTLLDDAAWVSQQLQEKFLHVRAAVILAQASPDRAPFFEPCKTAVAAFGKPVLYLNGDTHSWKQDNPFALPNTMRVVVQNGSEQPLQVTVTMDAQNPFQLKRNPWSNNPQPFNMPPCVVAGPDQTIRQDETLSLNGQASDNGIPENPGTITVTWSVASGPGTANFANPNALATTATFSTGGTYVLRLTADDGELQTSDEVTVEVQQVSPNIASFTPTLGQSGTVVTIFGNNFSGATSVAFNGTPAASFTVDSNTQLRATVPAGVTTGKISITNFAGTSSSTNDFVVPNVPTITSFTPNSGPPGTEVTIAGKNFTTTTIVSFNGPASPNFAIDSDTKLRAIVPANATTGRIIITNSAGTALSATNFTVIKSPVITTFTPNRGVVGAEITITGKNFIGITSISFNGGLTSSFTIDSDTQVRVAVPAGAKTGKIGVTNASGTGLSANDFLVLGQPTILTFLPVNGPVGTEITITGQYFTTATGVTFGNVTAASLRIISDTQLRATVPAGATTGKISVVNSVGTGVSANDFMVIFVPQIASISPGHSPAGAEVTITGSNFAAISSVSFNNLIANSFTVISPTQINAIVPDGASTGKITVTNSAGTGVSATDFIVITTPEIVSFTPSDGPISTEITIVGNHFLIATSVTFNGVMATSFTIDSNTQLRATAPPNASTGKIAVTSALGTGLSANDFIVTAVPVITSFSPANGPVGTEVTITGNNFMGNMTVTFNGNVATILAVDSNNQIQAIVPPGTATGKIKVTNSAGTGTSANNFIVTNSPSITSFTPTAGRAGTEVIITGQNFIGATMVAFNETATPTFMINSNTQIRAIVPEGATTGTIGVTNSAGTGFSGAVFTIIPPPSISSFTPGDGPEGTEVTITGSSFTDLTAVAFNETPSGSFALDSDNQIRAIVPASAPPGGGKIRVTTTNGTHLSAADFIVTRVPVITAFAPSAGPVGTSVTITGNHFDAIKNVAFNGVTATSFTVLSKTQLRAIVPVGAGVGKISVTNSAGTGQSASDYIVTLVPSLTSFTPDNGVIGTFVTITGTNFINITRVSFNDAPSENFTVDSETQLRAAVPAGATTGKIVVTSSVGADTSANDFIVAKIPQIISVMPNSGPVGAEVTITGMQLLGVNRVTFKGKPATNFVVDSDTQIRAIVPVDAITGRIVVRNLAGTGTSPDNFVVTAAPTITGFAPSDGPVGTEITITGTNFTAIERVTFNDVYTVNFAIDSENLLRVVLPNLATTGKIAVTNSAGTALSTNDFIVTKTPVIASFTPLNGPVGTNVTLSGINLTGTSKVTFNGIPAVDFTVNSDTQLDITVPVGAISGKIVVSNSAGSDTSGRGYLVTLIPTITSFVPNFGAAGTEVTINGSNIAAISSLTFNNIPVTNFTIDSKSRLRTRVPTGASTGKIAISNSAGSSLSADDFNVVTISAFSPGDGPTGTVVTLSGTYLNQATGVSFNGVSAADFTIDSDSQIHATVPPGAPSGGGKIAVTFSSGVAASLNDFIVTLAPKITAFSPSDGPVGAVVTITGNHFMAASEVTFNGTAASNFVVDSDASIRATVPVGATSGKITVTNSAGSGESTNDFVVTEVPVVASFTPVNGPVGTQVTISGNSFFAVSAVSFNGTPATTFRVNSENQIQATVPSTAITGKIGVANSAGTGLSNGNFLVTKSPAIFLINPKTGPEDTEVTITGTNFDGVTLVKFNGTPATNFAIDSNTQIRARVPLGATTGKVSVTNSAGIALSGGIFTVKPPPTIASFTPTEGQVGTEVTIAGLYFTGLTDVKFGEISAGFTLVSDTQIRAFIPAGAKTGTIRITTTNGSRQSNNHFTVIYIPEITSVTPADGPVGTAVIISGFKFTATTRVTFNDTPAPGFILKSDSLIHATVPAGATTGKIGLTNSAGTGFSSSDFIVTLPPVITSFSVGDAPVGAEVTIIGNNLAGASKVTFNGVEASQFTVESNTQLRVTVPAGVPPGRNKITVTNSAGSHTSEAIFVVTSLPQIASVMPGDGPVGTLVTITGSDFIRVTSVMFNPTGVAGAPDPNFTLVSDSEIHATVPAGATTGNIGVINSAGTGLSPANFIVTVKPSITSFSPVEGFAGTEVRIMGKNFAGASSVTFNDIPSADFTVDSNTQIRAKVPVGATAGKIKIINSAGTDTSLDDFTVFFTPVIASFTPGDGSKGTEVTLIGSHFDAISSVAFNGTAANGFTVVSDSILRAIVPDRASTGKIGVINQMGGAGFSANDFVVINPRTFSFTPTQDATVKSLNPTNNYGDRTTLQIRTRPGEIERAYLKFEVTGLTTRVVSAKLRLYVTDESTDGGTVYRVGNNYKASATPWTELGLRWENAPDLGSAALSTVGLAKLNSTIEFDVSPLGGVTGNGTYSFGLTNNNTNRVSYSPKEGNRSPKLVIETLAGSATAPMITAFAPADGPANTEVTISGNNFTAITNVQFNGTRAASFIVDSPTQIRARVPAGSTKGKISVTNANGTGMSAVDFITTYTPVIAAFTPHDGPEGITVTISGKNLNGTKRVTFDEVAAVSFTVVSDTELRVAVPARATTGLIEVSNSAGTALSEDEFFVTVPPVITSITPSHGSVGSEVIIKGRHFFFITSVTFDGIAAASFTVESDTLIRATVPTGASTGKIGVNSSAGTVESAGSFIVIQPPVITAFTPTSGPVNTEVKIFGSNFTGITGVAFNGVAATGFNVDSDTQIRAKVPTGAPQGGGKIRVNSAAGSVESADYFSVTLPSIVLEESQTGGASGSTSVTTSAGLIGANDHLYLAAISPRPKVSVLSVSGLDLTWTLVKSKCAGRNTTSIEVWMAQGTPSGNGVVTAMLASAPKTAVIAVSRYSGVTSSSPIGNVIAGNTNGLNANGACSGGVDGSSYSFNLTTTLNHAVVYAAVAIKDQTHTPGAGYTERAEIQQPNDATTSGVATEDKRVASVSTVAVTGSLGGGVDWALVALEIKPQNPGPVQYTLTANTIGSGAVTLNPAGGVYNSDAVVTLTPIPAAGFQFSGWSGDLTGSTNPAKIKMDANKNVTATFTALPPQFTLTVNTVGSGSVTLNPPGGIYNPGAVVTLTPQSGAGFQFSGWSGGLSGSANPANITIDANKNVTATFTAIPSSNQIVHEETQTGVSTGLTTVTTSATLTGGSGHLYLAAISTRPKMQASSVSGLRLTWTLVKSQCSGRGNTSIEVWMAQGAPDGNSVVTATFASTATSAAIAVSRYSGVNALNPIGNMTSGNTAGVDGGCTVGLDASVYSFNLTLQSGAKGTLVYGAIAMRSKLHTPGSGYTERAEIMAGSAGTAASVAVEDKIVASASTVTVDGSFNGTVDWAVVALEIKPQNLSSISKPVNFDSVDGQEHEEITTSFPERLTLHPAYPNPFNAQTSIEYTLPLTSSVQLIIYNVSGQVVRRLVQGKQTPGHYRVVWDGKDTQGKTAPSGIYYCHLKAGRMILVRPMTVTK